jgi:hypothetical protein
MHIFYEKEESGELVHMGTCDPASFQKNQNSYFRVLKQY